LDQIWRTARNLKRMKGASVSTSEKKIAANRTNGHKSRGPKNTNSTRFNAAKHGLLAVGITELDDAEGFRTILSNLMREKSPVGAIETYLVESAALEMVRWKRARRLEAEYITSELNPPLQDPPIGDLGVLFQGEVLDPGLPAAISPESAHRLVGIFQRYESFFANRLFRILHELERLQRMRQGERLPAPATVDVSVHDDTGVVGSTSAGGEQEVPLVDGESLPALVTADASAPAETETVGSARAAREQPSAPPGAGE
jgi:hypothetical protein